MFKDPIEYASKLVEHYFGNYNRALTSLGDILTHYPNVPISFLKDVQAELIRLRDAK